MLFIHTKASNVVETTLFTFKNKKKKLMNISLKKNLYEFHKYIVRRLRKEIKKSS